MEYVTIVDEESYGSQGILGIKILVASSKILDVKSKDIRISARKAKDILIDALSLKIMNDDPNTAIATANNRKIVDNVFESFVIFVEEIENGYCNKWCCKHLPWFIVTTKVGRIKIGWRKRVIKIDWSETIGTKTAIEIFEDQDVTKGDKFIHAWSIEDAKLYVNNIINNVD